MWASQLLQIAIREWGSNDTRSLLRKSHSFYFMQETKKGSREWSRRREVYFNAVPLLLFQMVMINMVVKRMELQMEKGKRIVLA